MSPITANEKAKAEEYITARNKSAAPAPLIPPPPVGIEHVGVAEVAFLHRQAQAGKRPLRDRHLLHLAGDDLEDAGLQDHLRIGPVDLRELGLGPLEVAHQIGLAAPQAETAPDELGPGGLEHPDVIVEVAPAVEQAFHGYRARQVVLQHLPRNLPVELITPRLRRGRSLHA